MKKTHLSHDFFLIFVDNFHKKIHDSIVILFFFLIKSKRKLPYIDGHLFWKVFKKTCQFVPTLMTIFYFFWQNLDIFDQKSHDTRVILEHFLKNIGIYITLPSWSFFQKNGTKCQAYYNAQMVFPTHFLIFLSKIIMTMG